jgi:hypothetical protein
MSWSRWPISRGCLSLEKRGYWTSRRMISRQPKNCAKTYKVLSMAESRLPAVSSRMYFLNELKLKYVLAALAGIRKWAHRETGTKLPETSSRHALLEALGPRTGSRWY